jgi:hypothetical protein
MTSFRNLFSLGGGHPPSSWTSPPNPRRASAENDDLSWAEVDRGDDASAPNVAGCFGQARGDVHIDLNQVVNPFMLGGRGTLPLPPAGVPPQWGDPSRDAVSTHPTGGIPGTTTQGPPQPQAAQTGPTTHYSGMAATITKWGTGDIGTQSVEL